MFIIEFFYQKFYETCTISSVYFKYISFETFEKVEFISKKYFVIS